VEDTRVSIITRDENSRLCISFEELTNCATAKYAQSIFAKAKENAGIERQISQRED